MTVDHERIFLLSSGILCILLTISILLLAISHIKLYKITVNTTSTLLIKWLTNFVNILAFIASICLSAILLNSYINDESILSATNNIFAVIAGLCSNATLQPGSFIIYVLRLKEAFRLSIWNISNFVFIIILALLTGFVISSIILLYFLFLRGSWSPNNISNKEIQDSIDRLNISQQIFGFTIYILLICLFTNKWFKLTTVVKSTYIDEESLHIEMSSKKKRITHKTALIKKNKKGLIIPTNRDVFAAKHDIMDVVRKITILLTISIVSSALLNILFLTLKYAFPDSHYDTILVRDYQCVYCLIEVICLHINYKSMIT